MSDNNDGVTAHGQAAVIQRTETSDEGTFGFLIAGDGALKLHTLELPWRDIDGNDVGDSRRSCINAGSFRVTWAKSPAFGRYLYRLDDRDTAPRASVLIHSGNFAGDVDKGFRSDVLGCILLGKDVGKLQVPNSGGKLQRAVLQSKNACEALEAYFGRQPFMLTILPIETGARS